MMTKVLGSVFILGIVSSSVWADEASYLSERREYLKTEIQKKHEERIQAGNALTQITNEWKARSVREMASMGLSLIDKTTPYVRDPNPANEEVNEAFRKNYQFYSDWLNTSTAYLNAFEIELAEVETKIKLANEKKAMEQEISAQQLEILKLHAELLKAKLYQSKAGSSATTQPSTAPAANSNEGKPVNLRTSTN